MPWYDSTPMCWLLLISMAGLVLFSIMGLVVALENPSYRRHWWVPLLLGLPSLLVGLSVSIRLIHRHQQQRKEAAEP